MNNTTDSIIYNVKNIYAHEKNQAYIKSQIETHLKSKFNININNIPNIDDQVQTFMYKSFCKFKEKNENTPTHIQSTDPYDIIEELNNDSITTFITYYMDDFKTRQNIYSNSQTSDNYCSFTDKSFNQASTFLSEQQKVQEHHINKIMMRAADTDAYFAERNTSMSGIYKSQGCDPRELHQNIVKTYEDNKKRADIYRLK